MSTKGKSLIDPEFSITPKMREWANEHTPRLDIDYYLPEFVDYWLGCGRMMRDWSATWRNRMRTIYQGNAYGIRPGNVRYRKPRAVSELPAETSEHEQFLIKLDDLRAQAKSLGMDHHDAMQKTPTELHEFIKGEQDAKQSSDGRA